MGTIDPDGGVETPTPDLVADQVIAKKDLEEVGAGKGVKGKGGLWPTDPSGTLSASKVRKSSNSNSGASISYSGVQSDAKDATAPSLVDLLFQFPAPSPSPLAPTPVTYLAANPSSGHAAALSPALVRERDDSDATPTPRVRAENSADVGGVGANTSVPKVKDWSDDEPERVSYFPVTGGGPPGISPPPTMSAPIVTTEVTNPATTNIAKTTTSPSTIVNATTTAPIGSVNASSSPPPHPLNNAPSVPIQTTTNDNPSLPAFAPPPPMGYPFPPPLHAQHQVPIHHAHSPIPPPQQMHPLAYSPPHMQMHTPIPIGMPPMPMPPMPPMPPMHIQGDANGTAFYTHPHPGPFNQEFLFGAPPEFFAPTPAPQLGPAPGTITYAPHPHPHQQQLVPGPAFIQQAPGEAYTSFQPPHLQTGPPLGSNAYPHQHADPSNFASQQPPQNSEQSNQAQGGQGPPGPEGETAQARRIREMYQAHLAELARQAYRQGSDHPPPQSHPSSASQAEQAQGAVVNNGAETNTGGIVGRGRGRGIYDVPSSPRNARGAPWNTTFPSNNNAGNTRWKGAGAGRSTFPVGGGRNGGGSPATGANATPPTRPSPHPVARQAKAVGSPSTAPSDIGQAGVSGAQGRMHVPHHLPQGVPFPIPAYRPGPGPNFPLRNSGLYHSHSGAHGTGASLHGAGGGGIGGGGMGGLGGLGGGLGGGGGGPKPTPEANVINVDRIEQGVDTRTTVMLKNIPNKVRSAFALFTPSFLPSLLVLSCLFPFGRRVNEHVLRLRRVFVVWVGTDDSRRPHALHQRRDAARARLFVFAYRLCESV